MKRFWAQSLRRQLLIAICLLLIPVLAAAVWSSVSTLRERIDDLRDESRVVASTTAAWISRDLNAFDRIASPLADADPVRRLDVDASTELLAGAVSNRPNILAIILARADGSLVAQGASASLPVDPGTAWAKKVAQTGQRAIVPINGKTDDSQYLVFAYPVRDASQQIVGALGYLSNLKTVHDALAVLPLPPGSVVTIVDHEGRILARSVDAARYVGQLTNAGQPATNGTPTAAGRSSDDGVDRMYGDAVASGGLWTVSVGIPLSVARSKALALWTRSFAILVLGLAGWVAVAMVLSRRLSATVSHLDATAQRIAAGDFSAIEKRPMLSREFAELQGAFDAMLRRFNTTREALDARAADERRIRQELQSLQGQVIRQERLAAVGQLVSGVAHEINNPLQAILGFAELLQMQPDVPETVKSDLRLIQKESARACGIIRNLALFARQQPGEAAPVRLSDIINSVVELRQRRLESEHIELTLVDDSTECVMAVSTELQQVVLNFVVNAEQAIVNSGRQPGRITIRTTDKDGRAVLEVEDTGPGIPPEDEARLFEPFFTTKPVGQGTGLGLSVSYGIIDSLGGRIGYKRAGAGGAIFYFDLPVVSEVEA